MKYILFVFALLATHALHAEGTADTLQIPLDYWMKKCEPAGAHYYRIAYREGKWWHVQDVYAETGRLRMDGMYSDDSFRVGEGMFNYYHLNGRLEYKVRYIKGEMEGMRKQYDTAGHLVDSAIYVKGVPKKAHYKWDADGKLIFKGVYDDQGYGVGQEWEYFPDGKLSAFGNTSVGAKKDSIWTYYYPSGVMSCQDFYDKGAKGGRICYDKEGKQYDGTCEDVPAQPIEKSETISNRFGQRYGDYKYTDSREGNMGTAQFTFKKGTYIVMRVYVDETGKMTKVDVVHKVHPKADQLIIDIYTGITKFKPAMKNNYPIKSSFEQAFPLFGL